MNRFFFNRASEPETRKEPSPVDPVEIESALRSLAEIQSITASAIFAKLVSKGVLSAEEAADYMGEIAEALEIDVRSPVASAAANMLRSYGQALSAAGK